MEPLDMYEIGNRIVFLQKFSRARDLPSSIAETCYIRWFDRYVMGGVNATLHILSIRYTTGLTQFALQTQTPENLCDCRLQRFFMCQIAGAYMLKIDVLSRIANRDPENSSFITDRKSITGSMPTSSNHKLLLVSKNRLTISKTGFD